MTKNEKTIKLEKAIDGARRIIKPEEPEKETKPFSKWLIEPFDDRGELDLTKQIDVLKVENEILKSRLDLAAATVTKLEQKLFDAEKYNDILKDQNQLAELALDVEKNKDPK
jgi:hypothetical protein